MKKDKFKECRECLNLDAAQSNENWVVCPGMPVAVIIAGNSENCEKYKRKAT